MVSDEKGNLNQPLEDNADETEILQIQHRTFFCFFF